MAQELGLEDNDPQVMQFCDDNIISWLNQTIIEDTKAVARAANLSASYIESIIAIKTGFAKARIENIHEHAKRIECGTKPHIITPKGSTGGRNTAKALKIPPKFKGGILAKVNHPGTRPMLIMTKGQEIGLPRFIDLSKEEIRKFKESL